MNSKIKLLYMVIIILGTLPLMSCGDNKSKNKILGGVLLRNSNGTSAKTATLGTISLGMGGNVFLTPHGSRAPSLITKGTVKLASVEITKNGSSWVPLLATPTTLTVYSPRGTGPFVYILNNPIDVEPGEYHGVKIVLSRESPTVLETNTGEPVSVTLNDVPKMSYYNGAAQDKGVGSEAILTSQNGWFIPFTVDANKNIYLVLDLSFQGLWPSTGEWQIMLGARATTFPPQS